MSPDFRNEDRKLLSDLFHALNQPLTSLHCCLELCVQPSNQLGRHLRRNLELALRQAQSVVLITKGIRELVSPLPVDVAHEAINLEDCLRETAADLELLAAAGKKRFKVTVHASCPVSIACHSLREALFRLIDFAIRHARAGTSIKLAVEQTGESAVLTILFAGHRRKKARASSRQSSVAQEPEDRLNLAIARRILTEAGCIFEAVSHSNSYRLLIRMPLVAREPAMPLTRRLRRPA
jgi:K+-sensing histidine kinase KdpD